MNQSYEEKEKEKIEESMRDPRIDRAFYEEIVAMVQNEFQRRKNDRNVFDTQCQMNFDFLAGRQYVRADYDSVTTIEMQRLNDSQERVVYNQIAPIHETRVAKLRKLNTHMSVISSTSENEDIQNAELATEILKNTYNNLNFDDLIYQATVWSEICGSAFIKNTWENEKGEVCAIETDADGNETKICGGDIAATVVSPFEIYPDDVTRQTIAGQMSLIHARVYSRNELFLKYGIVIAGSENAVYKIGKVSNHTGGYDFATRETATLAKDMMGDSAVLIEYYERPNRFYPNGRLIIVCEDQLIRYGDLPYCNGPNQSREFPFVKIDCVSRINSFFGSTVIERLIPIQQNYNSIHARINEYIKRVTLGVPLLEEDSLVNEDDIEENGFSPGIPVIYEKGSTPPRFMETPPLPATLFNKLAELKEDFIIISGVSEISRNSVAPGAVTSGVGLQLLQQQDETRIALTGRNILTAMKKCGMQWLYLYKEFATTNRMVRYTGTSYPVCRSWNNSILTSFDILVTDDSNMFNNTAMTRELVSSLFSQGVLGNDRYSSVLYLSIFGNGDINKALQEEYLDLKNAEKENLLFRDENVIPVVRKEDDHLLHLKKHNIFRKSDWYRDVLCRDGVLSTMAEKFNQHCVEHEIQLKQLSEEK